MHKPVTSTSYGVSLVTAALSQVLRMRLLTKKSHERTRGSSTSTVGDAIGDEGILDSQSEQKAVELVEVRVESEGSVTKIRRLRIREAVKTRE